MKTLEHALAYAERGWMVMPLHGIDEDKQCTCGVPHCPDAGKHPRLARGLRDASRDPAKIKEWFVDGSANIGIVTGQVSGITVIDIDIGQGKIGDRTWAALHEEADEPNTLTAKTGSGGLHLIFKYNSSLNTSSNTLGEGVDCRNDKGYIVAAPSAHRSGGKYQWVDFDAPLADLPPHLSKKKERRGRPKLNDPTRKKYTLEQAADLLEHVSPDDRTNWINVGVILGREYERHDDAWKIYNEWSAKWKGKPGRNHDKTMHDAFYTTSQQPGDLSFGTIVHLALAGGWTPRRGQVADAKFVYYPEGKGFIYKPTGAIWSSEGVDAAVAQVNMEGRLVKASEFIKVRHLVTSITNDPIITSEISDGHECRDGEIFVNEGGRLYNAYRKPEVALGDPKLAKPFADHCRRIFVHEGDADQFMDYMAHRVQQPGEKPRFSLLIVGPQGVGKDTAISMCYPAIGAWNVANINPAALDAGFNEYCAAVLVVISEAANVHEMNRWRLNESLKVLISGLPDNATINPKYGRKFSVRLHNGTIITTNHSTHSLHIPPDDRRYDVIATTRLEDMGMDRTERHAYFENLWHWFYKEDGAGHVAAFLHARNIDKFNAASGQRITDMHKSMSAEGMESDSWLREALTKQEWPLVVYSDQVLEMISASTQNFRPQDYSGKMTAAFSRAGYERIRSVSPDGRWYVNGKFFSAYYDHKRINARDAEKQVANRKEQF